MINNKKTMQNTAKGFSLIELMIAMLIGLFLLAGIATSYVSSKKSSVKVDEMSKLEDNGRLALEVLSNAIEHTGYMPVANADPFNPPFILNNGDVTSVGCPGGGNSVESLGIFKPTRITKDGAAGSGDRIAIMYHGDSRVFSDCSGATLPATCQAEPPTVPSLGAPNKSRIYNAFFLTKNAANNLLQLRCAGSREKKVQILADGIEEMQFMYGVDTTDDGNANSYKNATNVAAWNSVVSVQIAVLVRSEKPVKPHKEKITYTLLDQSYTPTTKDRYQRAVFSTTVRLRNTL